MVRHLCMMTMSTNTRNWIWITNMNNKRFFITVASQITRQLNYLFNSLYRLTTNKTPKLHITDPFVRWINRCPMDSPHKGPVMRKALPCHDIIMDNLDEALCRSTEAETSFSLAAINDTHVDNIVDGNGWSRDLGKTSYHNEPANINQG